MPNGSRLTSVTKPDWDAKETKRANAKTDQLGNPVSSAKLGDITKLVLGE